MFTRASHSVPLSPVSERHSWFPKATDCGASRWNRASHVNKKSCVCFFFFRKRAIEMQAAAKNPVMAHPRSDRHSEYMADSPSFRRVYLPNLPPTRFHHPNMVSQGTFPSVERRQHTVETVRAKYPLRGETRTSNRGNSSWLLLSRDSPTALQASHSSCLTSRRTRYPLLRGPVSGRLRTRTGRHRL